MVKIDVVCWIAGKDFQPEKLPGLTFRNVSRKGEVILYGGFKGKVADGSWAILDIPSKFEQSKLDYVLTSLAENKSLIEKAGGSDINIAMNISYTDQCNFEFSPGQIDLINRIGVGISVSCYVE